MRLIIPGVLLSIPVLNWLWPLPLPMTVRLVVGVFFVIAAFYHQWCRLSSGSVLAPEMPRIIVILFNWAFGALLFLTVLQLATDLVSLVIAAINWQPPRINPAMRVTVGAIAALLSAIGVHNALRVPPVRDVHVELPGLGKGFDGYTILQLSDLHLTTLFPAKWAAAVVRGPMQQRLISSSSAVILSMVPLPSGGLMSPPLQSCEQKTAFSRFRVITSIFSTTAPG